MLKHLIKKFRYKLWCIAQQKETKKEHRELREKILNFYQLHPTGSKEIVNVLQFLTNHPLENLLYPGKKARSKATAAVNLLHDADTNLPYFVHEGKKLYFQQEATVTTQKNHYLSLLEEQQPDSPHLYSTPQYKVADGDVVYDIGSAEGMFALSNIEKAGHVVLFEANQAWLEALYATFAPWKDKVTIIPKYVSDRDDRNNISIDSFVREYGRHLLPDFVKMDVEGAEMRVLKGMSQTIGEKKLKLVITTYHHQDDYNDISAFLAERGFNSEASEGVTLIHLDELQPPYFRKALIRATNL